MDNDPAARANRRPGSRSRYVVTRARSVRPAFQPLEPRKLLYGDPVFNVGELNGQNGFVLPGLEPGGQLGFSTTSVGDINSDGIDDFAVSAPTGGGSLQEGIVYVVFGSPTLGAGGQFDLTTLDGSNGFVIQGVDIAGQAGWSLAALGDINSDGHDDLVVGTPFANAAHVVFGGPGVGQSGLVRLDELDGTNGFRIDGSPDGDVVGFAVAGAGDVNNDGVNDVLLGSPINGADEGAAYVVFGAAGVGGNGVFNVGDIDGGNGLTIKNAPGLIDELGWRVSSAGDLNFDGIDDIAIGAIEASANSAGAVYVIFGATGIGSGTQGLIDVSGLNGTDGFKISGVNSNDLLSTSIAGRGDVNGDGIDDLLVGSLIQNSFIIYGAAGIGSGGQFDLASLDGTNGFVAHLPIGAAAFVTFAGDLNDDNYDDVAIGSAGINEVYVFTGGPGVGGNGFFDVSTVDGENGFIIQGVQLNSGFIGEPISRGRDVNDDGLADLLLGGSLANQQTGEAFVLFGISISGLSAPVNLSATALDEMSIELQWNDTTFFEDGFEIERSLNGISGWTVVAQAPPGMGNSSTLDYQDGNLQPGTEYFYRVRAYNQQSNSAYSNIASAVTGLIVPDAPSNLQAAPLSSSAIRLNWNDNSANETGFNIYRIDGEFSTLVGTVGAGVTAFDDTGLSAGVTYYYIVRAFNDAGESDDSNIAFATTDGGSISVPDAPTSLSALGISQDSIRLDWLDASNNEDGFIIERAVDPNLIWFEIDTVGPNVTSYTDSGLPADSTYFYRVRAFNSAGSSTPSNVAGATTSSAQGGGRSTQLTDADGDIVTFSLVGVGGSITYTGFGDGGGIDTLYVATNGLSAGALVVSIVQGANGDGRIQIGQLQGDIGSGDLYVRVGTINFGVVDLVGEGAWICNVNRAVFGDVTGSASIQGQVADLTVRDVNTTGVITLCDVFSFRARSMSISGGFEAHSITNFKVDQSASLHLTTTGEVGVGSLWIGGDTMIRLDTHRIGTMQLLGDATFIGNSQIGDRLGRLKIGGSWLSGSLSVAHLAGKIEIVGNAGAGASLTASGGCVVVCGDSLGTFNLDRFARFIVKGNVESGAINATNSSSGVVCIKGDFAGGAITTDQEGLWCLKVCGSLASPAVYDSSGHLQKAVIRGALDGRMDVASTTCITVCDDFTGSFTASGADGEVVRKFVVKGAADAARFAAVGDVNCIVFGKMDQTEVYVGLATNWSGGLPESLGDFVRESVLNKLQVRGETRGPTIASASIASLCLREISDQATFHLAAGHVTRSKMIVENQAYNFGPDGLFDGLPMLAYLDINQLLESGGI